MRPWISADGVLSAEDVCAVFEGVFGTAAADAEFKGAPLR